jgi:hypothetical protein
MPMRNCDASFAAHHLLPHLTLSGLLLSAGSKPAAIATFFAGSFESAA